MQVPVTIIRRVCRCYAGLRRLSCWWQVLIPCFANLNYARDWLWRSHNLCRVSAYAFTNTAEDCLQARPAALIRD